MNAEQAEPEFSRANQLMIGRCYKQQGDVPMARLWTKKCLALPPFPGNKAAEDKLTLEEATAFLKSL